MSVHVSVKAQKQHRACLCLCQNICKITSECMGCIC